MRNEQYNANDVAGLIVARIKKDFGGVEALGIKKIKPVYYPAFPKAWSLPAVQMEADGKNYKGALIVAYNEAKDVYKIYLQADEDDPLHNNKNNDLIGNINHTDTKKVFFVWHIDASPEDVTAQIDKAINKDCFDNIADILGIDPADVDLTNPAICDALANAIFDDLEKDTKDDEINRFYNDVVSMLITPEGLKCLTTWGIDGSPEDVTTLFYEDSPAVRITTHAQTLDGLDYDIKLIAQNNTKGGLFSFWETPDGEIKRFWKAGYYCSNYADLLDDLKNIYSTIKKGLYLANTKEDGNE